MIDNLLSKSYVLLGSGSLTRHIGSSREHLKNWAGHKLFCNLSWTTKFLQASTNA